MSEHDNDGFYWEPDADDDLRQGDLLFNVPIALMPQRPRFVLGGGDTLETQTFDGYPENAPSDLIVVEAHFGVLGMIVTPTCHVSEEEKDQDVVAIVPVQSLNLVTGDINQSRSIREGKNVPKHLFHLPHTRAWRRHPRLPCRGPARPTRVDAEGQPARLPSARSLRRLQDRAPQGACTFLGERKRGSEHRELLSNVVDEMA